MPLPWTPSPDRTFPNRLPPSWWTLSASEVHRLLQPMVWPSGMRDRTTGPLLERLVHHHPHEVPHAMKMGLRPRNWPRTLDDAGAPLVRPGPLTSGLMFVIQHGDAAMVDQALSHGLNINAAELSRWPLLPLAVLDLSRSASPQSRVGRLNEQERRERERSILTVMRQHAHPTLDGEHTGDTVHQAVRQRLSQDVLAALVEHGVDPNDGGRTERPRGLSLALQHLVEEGDVHEFDRFLTWGLPWSQGPGDDQIAAWAIRTIRQRSSFEPTDGTDAPETLEGWAQRQIGMLGVLRQHGWVPGPVFRTGALPMAVRASTHPHLLASLIALGADPLARDGFGNTVLHHLARLTPEDPQNRFRRHVQRSALGSCGLSNLQALLDLGLDPSACNQAGETPVDRLRAECEQLSNEEAAQHATAIALLERTVLHRDTIPLRESWTAHHRSRL